jgi:hypothetical protein
MIPRILSIAGSDSGGGAGIQADIKTITMLGGHAMTAITAITAQNTIGVTGVMPVPTDMVLAQIDAVASDIGVDAVKIGMIGSAETALAVADRLEQLGVPVVLDPVMVATSGASLADAPTIAALRRLMAVSLLVTPNLPELEALGGVERADRRRPNRAGQRWAWRGRRRDRSPDRPYGRNRVLDRLAHSLAPHPRYRVHVVECHRAGIGGRTKPDGCGASGAGLCSCCHARGARPGPGTWSHGARARYFSFLSFAPLRE